MANSLRCDRCGIIHEGVLVRDAFAGRQSYTPEIWEPAPVNWAVMWTRPWGQGDATVTFEYALCPYCKFDLQVFLEYRAVSGRQANDPTPEQNTA